MAVTVTQGVTDIGLVIPVIMTVVSDILALFMEPPLIFFTGAAFAYIGFRVACYLVKSAKSIV